jgi:hypothetical protein
MQQVGKFGTLFVCIKRPLKKLLKSVSGGGIFNRNIDPAAPVIYLKPHDMHLKSFLRSNQPYNPSFNRDRKRRVNSCVRHLNIPFLAGDYH